MKTLPHRQQLMPALLNALKALGGSGTLDEMREQVILNLGIPEKLAQKKHRVKGGEEQRTQLEYDLAWARTALKEVGYLENSARGIWALTNKAQLDNNNIVVPAPASQQAEEAIEDLSWRDKLLSLLQETLTPSAFEHLIQRMLRETGFTQVIVTGRSNDGGIDGKGIARINGILSFHIVFQCKRFKGSVSPSMIRDFRGAMIGRADKGLFITTGTFTREAVKEATREGTVAIDLVDGLHLCDKLKDLRLGIRVQQVEQVSVDAAWFEAFNQSAKSSDKS
jgi:restriction system protein